MTLTDMQFEDIAKERGLSESATTFIQAIRTGQPVRRANRRINITGRFPSTKMGKTIQYESRSGEGLACTFYESDGEVVEYYDQPYTFRVAYQAPGSTNTHIEHTPDFLVIRRHVSRDGEVTHSITFEEWRSRERMENFGQGDPKRWVPLLTGDWTQLPIEEYLRELGLDYRIRLIDTTPEILARNYELLSDHFIDPQPIDAQLLADTRQFVASSVGTSLEATLASVSGLDVDRAFAMIAQAKLFANLRETLLTNHAAVRLYTDASLQALVTDRAPAPVERGEISLEAGAQVRLGTERFEILSVGEEKVYLTDLGTGRARELPVADFQRLAESGDIVGISDGRKDLAQMLLAKDPAIVALAHQRYLAIETYLKTGTYPQGNRSHERWLAAWHRGEELYGDGFVALLADIQERGNRTARLSEETEQLAANTIRDQMLRPDKLAIRDAHAIFTSACAKQSIGDMALSSFHWRYTLLRHADRLRARVGAKAANGAAMKGASGGLRLPPHGDRAFARVHIDHTTLDLVVMDSVTGEPLGRPEVTLVIDAYSRRILVALALFLKPSAETDMLAMRELVRQYHQMPTTVVVDGGSDFTSTYFESLCAALKSRCEHRRTGNPRDGGPVESAFKQLNTDLIWSMTGNTQILKNPRAMDPAYDPAKRGIWTLAQLQEELDRYIAWKNEQTVRSLGGSPRELFERSMRASGTRAFRRIAYTTAFRALTAHQPHNSPTATVTRDGVRINNLRYTCDAFLLPGVEGSKVRVRYEPLDARVAYALIGKQWHVCTAAYPELAGRSEKELSIASQELRKRLGKAPSTREIGDYLTAMLASEDKHKSEQKLRLRRAAEQKTLVASRDTLDEEPTPPALVEPDEAAPTTTETSSAPALVLEGYEQATPEELQALLDSDTEEEQAA